MAKTPKKAPARNFILEPNVKAKGRGSKRVEVVEGLKKTRLQSRLYCVPVFQGPIRKAKKSSKFECFTSIEAAQKAMGMPELPVPLAPAPGRGKRQGVKELRAEIARLMESRGAAPAAKPAFSPESLAAMEPVMKGLRGQVWSGPSSGPFTRRESNRAEDNQFFLKRWANDALTLQDMLESGDAAESPYYPEIAYHGDSYRDWMANLTQTGREYAEKYPTIRDTVERTLARLQNAYAEAQVAAGTEISERDGRRYPKLQGGKKGLRGTPAQHAKRAADADRLMGQLGRELSTVPEDSREYAELEHARTVLGHIAGENWVWSRGSPMAIQQEFGGTYARGRYSSLRGDTESEE